MLSQEHDKRDQDYAVDSTRLNALARQANWVLRITEHKDKPIPVLVMKERVRRHLESDHDAVNVESYMMKERGFLYGAPMRQCRSVLREILMKVTDQAGVPLELHRLLAGSRMTYRGNVPLDDEAGQKLALLFKLQERVTDMDRVELMGWRIERFTAEEASYWLTRILHYGEAENRWAQAGLRIVLAGQPGDKAIAELLNQLRK